jgi:hypothetical protein
MNNKRKRKKKKDPHPRAASRQEDLCSRLAIVEGQV